MSVKPWLSTLNMDLLSGTDTGGMLATEMGVVIRSKQDANLIESIAKPEKFVEKRSKAIAKLFIKDGQIERQYKARLAEFLDMGIPSGEARTKAYNSAVRMYEEELDILEFQMPGGYKTAFGVANINNNAIVAKNAAANVDLKGSEILAEYKKGKKDKIIQQYLAGQSGGQ